MTKILVERIAFGLGVWLALQMTATESIQGGEYDHLLLRIPDDANTLILLNVESIFASPLAEAEGWKQSYADNFAGTPLLVPPNAQRFVLGADLQIETMEPLWEAASMKLSVDPSIQNVAQRIGGVTDTLSGFDAVWPRQDLCIVKFGPAEFGVLAPASRQTAARWVLRSQRQSVAELSAYLNQAVRYAENSGPEIIMAIDLDQILRPEAIRAAVERSEFLRVGSRSGHSRAEQFTRRHAGRPRHRSHLRETAGGFWRRRCDLRTYREAVDHSGTNDDRRND